MIARKNTPHLKNVGGKLKFKFVANQEENANTEHYIEQATPDFIPSTLFFPPNSADLSLVDCMIIWRFGVIQQRVYQSRVHTARHQRTAQLACMDHSVIDNAIDKWRGRFRACMCEQTVDTSSNCCDK